MVSKQYFSIKLRYLRWPKLKKHSSFRILPFVILPASRAWLGESAVRAGFLWHHDDVHWTRVLPRSWKQDCDWGFGTSATPSCREQHMSTYTPRCLWRNTPALVPTSLPANFPDLLMMSLQVHFNIYTDAREGWASFSQPNGEGSTPTLFSGPNFNCLSLRSREITDDSMKSPVHDF